MTVEDFQKASFLKRLSYRLARNPLTILFGYITIFLFGMCLRSFLKDPVKHYDSAIALIVHGLLIGVFYHFGRDVLLLSFIFPLFVACALGSYLFYIQHNFPDMKLKSREEWTFLFAALYSSSFMDVSPIVHWFTGNIGYHHVHHLNSHIPFYRLPDAMAKIPELQNPGRTSLRPRDIYSCLKLKLWDPKLGKMT
jgi:omega-6 fatty acid desaturase (delta-12 desaturase)